MLLHHVAYLQNFACFVFEFEQVFFGEAHFAALLRLIVVDHELLDQTLETLLYRRRRLLSVVGEHEHVGERYSELFEQLLQVLLRIVNPGFYDGKDAQLAVIPAFVLAQNVW